MALRQFLTDFSNIGHQEFLRPNVGYRFFFDIKKSHIYETESSIKLKYVLSQVASPKISKGELDDGEILVDLENIERRDNNLINLLKVEEIGSDKNVLGNGDLIIPKIQPRMGNMFLNLDHKRYLASTELLEYKVSPENSPLFIYYLLTSHKFLSDLERLESGKTHRRVNPIDLLKVYIPHITRQKQDEIVTKIEPIENNIRLQKAKLKNPQEIFDTILSREFNFDIEKVQEIDKNNIISLEFSNVCQKNINLRSSYRWNQLQRVQKVLYSGNPYLHYLGDYIISTKNGWSPECNEDENGQPILGIDAILKTGDMTFNNLKFTQETRSDIQNFFIKDGDFYVSRGNTTDLVALASIVEFDYDEKEIIYPDLMIKVAFNESVVNKRYIAYIFNSIIGRIYFKYSAKGKNQTMVKISAKELYDFYLPIPDLKLQEKIVDEIKREIDANNQNRSIIGKEREKIDAIIENAIL